MFVTFIRSATHFTIKALVYTVYTLHAYAALLTFTLKDGRHIIEITAFSVFRTKIAILLFRQKKCIQ